MYKHRIAWLVRNAAPVRYRKRERERERLNEKAGGVEEKE